MNQCYKQDIHCIYYIHLAMKRQQDRDTPPKGKRSRASYIGHVDGDRDRIIPPDLDRRESRAKLGMGRDGKNHRDRDRDRGFDVEPDRLSKRHKEDRLIDDPFQHMTRGDRGLQGPDYRALCVSNLNHNVSDGLIKEALIKEFKKFGEFNVKVVRNGDQRIAFMNFCYAEDARDAKHARGNKLVLFDRPCRVEPVFKRQRSISPDYTARDMFQGRPVSPTHSTDSRRSNRHGSVGRDVIPTQQRHRDDFHNYDNRGRTGPPNEKFPHHLQHVLPEDDEKATRTLFVGNLDPTVTSQDLRLIFERYGVVEDVDIKPKKPNGGNAYAFVMFLNLDMAHRAKVDMSGEYIGRYQCKIGYGKATSSTCLWVGGLGPWIRTETLEREFDRFGVIHRIEWPQGKTYAYVLYDSIDAAQAACSEMRGFPLGGQNRRLRVDFADSNHISLESSGGVPSRGNQDEPRDDPFASPSSQPGMYERDSGIGRERGNFENQYHKGFSDNGGRIRGNARKEWPPAERVDGYRNPDNPRDIEYGDQFRRERNGDRGGDMADHRKFRGSLEDERTHRHLPSYGGNQFQDFGNHDQERDLDQHANNFRRNHSPHGHHRTSGDHERGLMDRNHLNCSPNNVPRTARSDREQDQGGLLNLASVAHVENVLDLAKCLPVVWSGALVLKTSAFAAKMHLVSGDVSLVDTLMRDQTTTEMAVLKITQRLRLDQPKLEEVGKRVSTSGPNGHAVLLAMPGSAQALEDSNTNVQQRPLRNLVSYLKQKEAAGVISLPPNPGKEKDNIGVLHAFPPCQFGHDYLTKCAPRLGTDPSKEEHLVVVVVRGIMGIP